MALKRKRATITKDARGEYRYHVQSRNGQVIEASEEGFKQKLTVVARLERKYPGIEIVDAS